MSAGKYDMFRIQMADWGYLEHINWDFVVCLGTLFPPLIKKHSRQRSNRTENGKCRPVLDWYELIESFFLSHSSVYFNFGPAASTQATYLKHDKNVNSTLAHTQCVCWFWPHSWKCTLFTLEAFSREIELCVSVSAWERRKPGRHFSRQLDNEIARCFFLFFGGDDGINFW